jgi:hypothetical protein
MSAFQGTNSCWYQSTCFTSTKVLALLVLKHLLYCVSSREPRLLHGGLRAVVLAERLAPG